MGNILTEIKAFDTNYIQKGDAIKIISPEIFSKLGVNNRNAIISEIKDNGQELVCFFVSDTYVNTSHFGVIFNGDNYKILSIRINVKDVVNNMIMVEKLIPEEVSQSSEIL